MSFDVWPMILLGVPLSLTAAGAGYLFLLRPIHGAGVQSGTSRQSTPPLFSLMLPILVVIACYAVIRLGYAGARYALPGLAPVNRYLPFAEGLFVAMLVLQIKRPLSRGDWTKIVFSRRAVNMAVIVAVVRIYGAYIEADLPGGESLVARLHSEMADWGIPAMAIIMLVPLISGLATGLSVGFVGASFPIVLSMLGEDPTFGTRLSTTALAYGFGYMGMLLSPVHVCLIVTSKYFHTALLRNVAGMLSPAAVVMTGALLLHLLLGWLVP